MSCVYATATINNAKEAYRGWRNGTALVRQVRKKLDAAY